MKRTQENTGDAKMTATDRRRIARYEKLLATLRRTESLISECEVPDGGSALGRTRHNISTVESLIDIWKRASA